MIVSTPFDSLSITTWVLQPKPDSSPMQYLWSRICLLRLSTPRTSRSPLAILGATFKNSSGTFFRVTYVGTLNPEGLLALNPGVHVYKMQVPHWDLWDVIIINFWVIVCCFVKTRKKPRPRSRPNPTQSPAATWRLWTHSIRAFCEGLPPMK